MHNCLLVHNIFWIGFVDIYLLKANSWADIYWKHIRGQTFVGGQLLTPNCFEVGLKVDVDWSFALEGDSCKEGLDADVLSTEPPPMQESETFTKKIWAENRCMVFF